MINLYYTVEKKLEPSGDFEETERTTGEKLITVYDIDAQSMGLVIMCEIESNNSSETEGEIQIWLDNNNDDQEYKFIKL